MLFQTKLVTVTEELNSRRGAGGDSLSRTLGAGGGGAASTGRSRRCRRRPTPRGCAARLSDAAQLDPAQPNLRQLLAEAPPLAGGAASITSSSAT